MIHKSERVKIDAPHHATEQAAIDAARLVLHGIIDHGTATEIDITPDEMPDVETRLACIAIRAAAEAGKRELPEVLPFVMVNHPQAQSAVVECTQAAAYAYPVAELAPLAERVREHHRSRRKWQLGQAIATATTNGEAIGEMLAELQELDAGTGQSSLVDRAYRMAFNPEEIPPPDESCLVIGDVPIAARGNLSAIQGKSKVGKSAVVAAILVLLS